MSHTCRSRVDKQSTVGNRFKKSICLFLNPIVELLLFCLYMSVIPIKYVYTNCSLQLPQCSNFNQDF